MSDLLVNYPDGTSVKFQQEGRRILLVLMNHVVGLFEAPDEERSKEILKRVENGDGELVKRIFENLLWLPGTSAQDAVDSIEAAAAQTGNNVEQDLGEYSPVVIQQILDYFDRQDRFKLVERPSIDDPIIEVERTDNATG